MVGVVTMEALQPGGGCGYLRASSLLPRRAPAPLAGSAGRSAARGNASAGDGLE